MILNQVTSQDGSLLIASRYSYGYSPVWEYRGLRQIGIHPVSPAHIHIWNSNGECEAREWYSGHRTFV